MSVCNYGETKSRGMVVEHLAFGEQLRPEESDNMSSSGTLLLSYRPQLKLSPIESLQNRAFAESLAKPNGRGFRSLTKANVDSQQANRDVSNTLARGNWFLLCAAVPPQAVGK